jgi:small conductance mechanosensitive channel
MASDLITVLAAGPNMALLNGESAAWQSLASASGDFMVRLAVGVVVLLVTLWASGAAAAFVRRLFKQFHRAGVADQTLQSFVASMARYGVLIIGGVAVLQQLGVQTTSVLAVLGAASLAVGLALQGTLSNLAAGVMLLLFRPYHLGDFVEIGGRSGTVTALDLFVTELATLDNIKVVVPNGKVFGDTIVNFSHHAQRRLDLVFRIDFDDDLAAALGIISTVASQNPVVLTDPAPLCEATNVTENWTEVTLRAWIAKEDLTTVRSDLLVAVLTALKAAGYGPAYPHQVGLAPRPRQA